MFAHSCLSRVPIFSQLTAEEKNEVHNYLHPMEFGKGDTVSYASQKQPRLLVLNRGSAKIVRTSVNGREQIIRVLKPGDYIGELAVFTGTAPASDVIATENSSFCALEQPQLHKLLVEKPAVAIRLLADLSTRLEKTEAYAESLGTFSATERLFDLLLELSGGQQSFKLPLPKKDLASRIGVTPETLSRTLKKLQAEGRITLINKTVGFLQNH